jgi:hypothetical protein
MDIDMEIGIDTDTDRRRYRHRHSKFRISDIAIKKFNPIYYISDYAVFSLISV